MTSQEPSPTIRHAGFIRQHIVTPNVLEWLRSEVFDDPVKLGRSTSPVPEGVVYDHDHRWLAVRLRQAPSTPGNALKTFNSCTGADKILLQQWGECVTRTGVRYVGLFAHALSSAELQVPEGVDPGAEKERLEMEAENPIDEFLLWHRWGKYSAGAGGVKIASLAEGPGFHFRAPGSSGRCFRDNIIYARGAKVNAYWHGKNRLMHDEILEMSW